MSCEASGGVVVGVFGAISEAWHRWQASFFPSRNHSHMSSTFDCSGFGSKPVGLVLGSVVAVFLPERCSPKPQEFGSLAFNA